MRVIAKRTLVDFWGQHPDAEGPLNAWYQIARQSDWGTPAQVKADYPAASILANNRVVFNIKGNSYRIVVEVRDKSRMVFLRFVGTHREYDEIDAATV